MAKTNSVPVSVSVGEMVEKKSFPCIEIFFFDDGNAKCTFLRTKSTPLEKDENWKVTKWAPKETSTFYEIVNGLDRNTKPSDLKLFQINSVQFA